MLKRFRRTFFRSNYRTMRRYDVNLEQMERMVANGAILLDVRSPQEYEEGHLNNSISLPEYEIKLNILNIVPDKQQEIIVYCSSGSRSMKAQRILQQMGYTNVYNLYQGLESSYY